MRLFSVMLLSLLVTACGPVVRHNLKGEAAKPHNVAHLYTYSATRAVGAHIIQINNENIFRDPTHYELAPGLYALTADWTSFDPQSIPKGATHETVSAYLGPVIVIDSMYRSKRKYIIESELKSGKAYYIDMYTNNSLARNPDELPTKLCLLEAAHDDKGLITAPSSAVLEATSAGAVVACSDEP